MPFLSHAPQLDDDWPLKRRSPKERSIMWFSAILLSGIFLPWGSCQLFALSYGRQSPPASGASSCPQVSRRSSAECAGQQSTCWSPGVRDLDCPSSGLCCSNGCVNVCQGPPGAPKSPPVAPAVVSTDPCNPSPCGPGAYCSPSPNGHPICRCREGLVPKPDTITGCGPECIRDPDCQYGLVCLNQRCVDKPDPCNPSPCGPGAACTVNAAGNPICRCEPGLIPKPDTITGCGPECSRDADCSSGHICQNQRCVVKPDPCNPSPCGPGTTCMTNSVGNPICRCEAGLIPKPDTVTGCGPECIRDDDCSVGFVCNNQHCVEKPDPCNPSPCGPGAVCMVNSVGNPICRCEEGLIPKPDTITGCGPECVRDPDCSSGFICQSNRCVEKPDPCNPSPCGPGANCAVNSAGNPICRCEPGLIPKPDTITGCGPECLKDSDCNQGFICSEQRCVEKPDPCNPSPCGPGTMCMANQFGNAVCRCLEGLVPMPDTISGCKPECEVDSDCKANFICKSQRCVERPDPCQPNPCGTNAICQATADYQFTCSCPPGYLGDPKVNCIQGECQVDPDCPDDKACENYHCKNPCQADTCKKTDFCKVIKHVPTCGFNFVAEEKAPREVFVIGESYKPVSNELSRSAVGHQKQSTIIGGAYQQSRDSSLARNVVVIGSRHDNVALGKRRKRHLRLHPTWYGAVRRMLSNK